MPTSTTSEGVFAPLVEGNFQYGLSRAVAVSVHGGPSGLQPGMKFSLIEREKFRLSAILPEIAFAYGLLANGARGGSSYDGRSSDAEFLAGGRLLFSISKFYGGVGYDFVYEMRNGMVMGAASTSTTSTMTASHNIIAAVGCDLPVGILSLRPEIAFVVQFFGSVASDGVNPNVDSAGTSWAIVPNVSVAFGSSRPASPTVR